MSDVPAIPILDDSRTALRARWKDYVELTKPRISGMVLVAAAFGFLVGSADSGTAIGWARLLNMLLGLLLVGGGANALNQYLEIEHDARMPRTANRPLPSGRMSRLEGFAFGMGTSVGGVLYLLLTVNLLASAAAALALTSYVLVYTPLKRVGAFCVYVGAIPGALPPVVGYAAATGQITAPALMMFAILFLWQLPHFLAIAWMYRDEYRAAGYPLLTVVDQEGVTINMHMITHTLALIVLSMMPFTSRYAGPVYAVGAAGLGLAFLGMGVYFLLRRTRIAARRHLLASIVYLPALFGLMVVDRLLLTPA